jgi:hypothetical protein
MALAGVEAVISSGRMLMTSRIGLAVLWITRIA